MKTIKPKIKDISNSNWELEPEYNNNRPRLRVYNKDKALSVPNLPVEQRPLILTWSTTINRNKEDTSPPKYSILSNQVVFLVVKVITIRERSKLYKTDFNINGDFQVK